MSSWGTVALAPSDPSGYAVGSRAYFTFTNAVLQASLGAPNSIEVIISGSPATTYQLLKAPTSGAMVITEVGQDVYIISQSYSSNAFTVSFQYTPSITALGVNTFEFKNWFVSPPPNITHTLTAYAWSAPIISQHEAQRYNTITGQGDANGTYLRARSEFAYSPMNGQVPVQSTLAWRPAGGSWSAEVPFTSGAWTSAFGSGTIVKSQEYEVRFTVKDPRGVTVTAVVAVTRAGYAYRRYFDGSNWSPWVVGGW